MAKVVIIFSIIYFPIATTVGISWLQSDNVLSLIVWQLFLAKTVYEITRMSFALFLKKERVQTQKELDEYPPVALLYTCRDDIVPECLNELRNQQYPNLDIFVLDDSTIADFKNIANVSQYKVIRRNSLRGYKAGNLNHWLKKYGYRYKYFIVFDNDSKAPPNFVEKMVMFAEHPSNHDVAIFQSKIIPWNTSRPFPRMSGIMAPLFMDISSKLGNRTGTVISSGHNNLHRVDVMLSIGGFDEELTAEDVVATLELDKEGYRTILVDVVSFEAEPENIYIFCRRAERWAGQTAALFRRSWVGVSAPLKIEISRQLIYYLVNGLFFGYIFGSLWFSGYGIGQISASSSGVIDSEFFARKGILSFVIISVFLSNHFIAFYHACRCGIKLKAYLESLLFSFATYLYIFIPVTKSLFNAALGRNVVFSPSNSDNTHYSLTKTVRNLSFPLLVSFFSLVRYFWLINGNPWAYFGWWWITAIVFTPLFLHFIHTDDIKASKRTSDEQISTQIKSQ